MYKKLIPVLITLGLLVTAAGCASAGQSVSATATQPASSASQGQAAASDEQAASGEADKAPPAQNENECFGRVSAVGDGSLTLETMRGPGGGGGGGRLDQSGSAPSGMPEGEPPEGEEPPAEGEEPPEAPSGSAPEAAGESREIKVDASTLITSGESGDALSLADIQTDDMLKVILAEDGSTALSIVKMQKMGGETDK